MRASSRRPRTQTGTDSAIGRIAAAHAQREERQKKKQQEEEKAERSRKKRQQQDEEDEEQEEEEEAEESGGWGVAGAAACAVQPGAVSKGQHRRLCCRLADPQHAAAVIAVNYVRQAASGGSGLAGGGSSCSRSEATVHVQDCDAKKQPGAALNSDCEKF